MCQSHGLVSNIFDHIHLRRFYELKGIVYPKWKILSLFSHPNVVLYLQTWSEMLAALVNMIKEGCGN